MLSRWLLKAVHQISLLVSLGILPIIWIFGVGGFSYLELAYDLNFYALLTALLSSRGEDVILSTGLVLIISSLIYLRLPIPLFPMYIPLLGRVDRFLATTTCVMGIILILVRIVNMQFLNRL